MREAKRDGRSLIAFLAIAIVIQLIAGLWTSSSVGTWYTTLQRAPWNPPGWVFGPVWTALYITIAIAGWLVWRKRGEANIRPAMTWYAVQFALNLAWSGLFFGMRQPALALLDLILLLTAIVLTIRAFRRIHPFAGTLLIPYALWVAYATTLNAAIWYLN